MGIICLLKPLRYLASFRSKSPCKFWGWGKATPKLGERGGARGQNGPIWKRNIDFLLAPHSDQRSISKRFTELSNVTYRRTDRHRIGIAIARPHVARWRACIRRSKISHHRCWHSLLSSSSPTSSNSYLPWRTLLKTVVAILVNVQTRLLQCHVIPTDRPTSG